MSEQQIELVLPEEEVDPREADVIQERQQDQDFGEKETEQAAELEDYSDSVKKRIDKLTYRMREAERQRDEAVNFAQNLQQEKSTLATKLSSSDASLVNEYKARVDSESERARKALREAQEIGDAEAIALATEAVAKSALESQNATKAANRQKLQNRRRLASNRQNNEVNSQAQPQQPPPRDEKAEAWAEKNSWFGQDRVMTSAAIAIDDDLKRSGVDPTSDEYYQELNAQLRDNFPHKFDKPKNVQSQQVAGSSRGASPASRGARKVSLTPSQVAIAKRIGVPLEEYAKYV
jgi:chromosome segregation ATPase